MRKTISAICLLVLIHGAALSQPHNLIPGGLFFRTQGQIDSFQINYPGITIIEGEVKIVGNDITNLDGLITIEAILLSLRIFDNPNLPDLSGLDSVKFVGGTLQVENNPLLTDITAFNNLDADSISSINITGNAQLSICNAQCICDFLANPPGPVSIYNNSPGCNTPVEIAGECGISLSCLPFGHYYFMCQTEIDSFPNHFPGCSDLKGSVIVTGNDITSLNGLSAVTSISGGLDISDNPGLKNIDGLSQVTSIGGLLMIHNNPSLPNLSGLINLDSVGSQLSISNNDSLTALTGLDSLTCVGSRLDISDNANLLSLNALGNLTSVGELRIEHNPALTTISGLSNVNTYTDPEPFHIIDSNVLLTSLTGLESITSCKYIYIIDNNSLTNLEGLDNLTSVSNTCGIQRNDSLTSLSGLNNFDSVGKELYISFNNSLTNLTGIENLRYIGTNIYINENAVLLDLTGLDSLQFIGGNIYVVNNLALSSLTGIDQVDADSMFALVLANNPSLTTCEVECVCEYLTNLGAFTLIENNAQGCNSRQEIEVACATLQNLYLTDDTINNGQAGCYDAIQTITVAGTGTTFIVENGGSATMIAGQMISYLPGTIVQSGGYMHGYIAPTGPWCSSLAPSIPSIVTTEDALPVNLVQASFKVYPNPTSGTFILEFIDRYPTDKVTVNIYGMRGEKVLSEVLKGGRKHEFSLSNRPPGIYLIHVITNNKSETAKIIKH